MVGTASRDQVYSIIIAIQPEVGAESTGSSSEATPVGEIEVDWVDFTREKSIDRIAYGTSSAPSSQHIMVNGQHEHSHRNSGAASGSRHTAAPESTSSRRRKPQSQNPSDLSLQPLLAHLPGQHHSNGPNPLDASVASGVSQVGRGVVHLFRHAPPAALISSLDAHPVGESSRSAGVSSKKAASLQDGPDYAGQQAEGEDGSLVAIIAVPAWMRPADFLEFIGGWGTCLEGVRMIREATTPNRSIVLLKFRDPLQASDFLVIFTGRAFSSLDPRETCHPIRIHHLVLHKLDKASKASAAPIPIPAFPPSTYSSRASAMASLLPGVDQDTLYELPSCPVCLERLDSSVTGLVTLPCAHTFDCDCLRKWGDSRCPVCRVSHLLLSAHAGAASGSRSRNGPALEQATRLTKCAVCDATEQNWICVVCGVVGCGRYDPGKGHARRHWEESGHVLAMELDTQRVWDYKGDNYVHRLIQTRTDGKLVELPSAASLITPSHSHGHLSRTLALGADSGRRTGSPSIRNATARLSDVGREHSPIHTPRDSIDSVTNGLNSASFDPEGDGHAGPSSGDVEKMSTIEAITLEYSYLLSSQLEAMRQHYDAQLVSVQVESTDNAESASKAISQLESAQQAARDAQAEREKAEKRATKAMETARDLHKSLQAEKALTQGLSQKVSSLTEKMSKAEERQKDMESQVKGLEETMRDLMFALEAGAKIKQAGGEDDGVGGDLVVRDAPSKKKGKK